MSSSCTCAELMSDGTVVVAINARLLKLGIGQMRPGSVLLPVFLKTLMNIGPQGKINAYSPESQISLKNGQKGKKWPQKILEEVFLKAPVSSGGIGYFRHILPKK